MNAMAGFELLDRRVLGAIVFVDPLGRQVTTAVAARPISPAVRLLVKRPGEIVILDAAGLSAQAASFDPPAPPPEHGSVDVVLDLKPADPGLGARRVTIGLPRDPDPTRPEAVATPVVVPLFASPAAGATGLAAALRVRVTRADDGRLIEGALVRLRPDGGRPEVMALTDGQGEALLLAAAIPLANPGPGATVTPDVAAQVDAIVDPASARFCASADAMAAQQAALARVTGLIDPDDLVKRLAAKATAPVAVAIAAGRTRTAAIAWSPA